MCLSPSLDAVQHVAPNQPGQSVASLSLGIGVVGAPDAAAAAAAIAAAEKQREMDVRPSLPECALLPTGCRTR
eukprot:COSAG02_NODE_9266_length_2273_cov_1.472861_3_plen_73_part_00